MLIIMIYLIKFAKLNQQKIKFKKKIHSKKIKSFLIKSLKF